MSSIPDSFLDPALWRVLKIDSLYTSNEQGVVRPSTQATADAVYNPSHEIPSFIFCRVSESTKRLENGLEAVPALDPKTNEPVVSAEGDVFTVVGSGSTIGVVFVVNTDLFLSAHCTPDGAHLLNLDEQLPEGCVMKLVYEYKTFRSFRFGPPHDEAPPHDLMITAKKRWFRKRNNPKALGFSKDDKV